MNLEVAVCFLGRGLPPECVWKGRLGQPYRRQPCSPEPWRGHRHFPSPVCPAKTQQPASVSFSIQSEVSFEGACGNLKRLYDKAAKMYHQLKKCETRKLSPSRKR